MRPHQGPAGRPLSVPIVEDFVEDAERAVLKLRWRKMAERLWTCRVAPARIARLRPDVWARE